MLKKSNPLFNISLGFFVSVIPYLMLVGSFYFVNNIYYMHPFIFIVALLSSIVFEKFFLFNKYVFFILFIVSLFFVNYEIVSFFKQIIPGQEIAGNYIKENSNPNTRLFIYGNSGVLSVCYYAERRCGFLPNSLEEFKAIYKKFDTPFIYVIATRFNDLKHSIIWNEINKYYGIKQVGGFIIEDDKSISPSYYILKKDFRKSSSEVSPVKNNKYHYYDKYNIKKSYYNFYTLTY